MCKISSISINEKTGTARLIIEGYIPTTDKCDDPIVELFRPIRNKYQKLMHFIILVKHTDDAVICDLYASNKRGRTVEQFVSTAVATLEGGVTGKGIVADYANVLEQYFEDTDGLEKYLANIAKAVKLENGKAAAIYAECDSDVKTFVTKLGLTMPSIKALTNPKPKPKKTKEEKRADSEAYLKAHPEILTKNNKKPAN